MPSRGVTIGTIPTPVLSYNNKRTGVSLANEDTATIFFGEDETSLLTQGYPILAQGAHDLLRALGDEPQNALFGISAAGGADLRVLEHFGELPVLFEPGSVERRGEVLA